ncbi:hypothetical protein EV1_021277 [Malus domestica]
MKAASISDLAALRAFRTCTWFRWFSTSDGLSARALWTKSFGAAIGSVKQRIKDGGGGKGRSGVRRLEQK